jgi:hypothetical protein
MMSGGGNMTMGVNMTCVVNTVMIGGGNMVRMNMTMVVETKDAAARSGGVMMGGGAVAGLAAAGGDPSQD